MPQSVNIHDNYCNCEECGSQRKLYVTRKGATSAARGQLGIIPSSMGQSSYITRGKGDIQVGTLLQMGLADACCGSRHMQIFIKKTLNNQWMELSVTHDIHPSVKDEAPSNNHH